MEQREYFHGCRFLHPPAIFPFQNAQSAPILVSKPKLYFSDIHLFHVYVRMHYLYNYHCIIIQYNNLVGNTIMANFRSTYQFSSVCLSVYLLPVDMHYDPNASIQEQVYIY